MIIVSIESCFIDQTCGDSNSDKINSASTCMDIPCIALSLCLFLCLCCSSVSVRLSSFLVSLCRSYEVFHSESPGEMQRPSYQHSTRHCCVHAQNDAPPLTGHAAIPGRHEIQEESIEVSF